VARAAGVLNSGRSGKSDPEEHFLVQSIAVTLEESCGMTPMMMVDETRDFFQGGVATDGWSVEMVREVDFKDLLCKCEARGQHAVDNKLRDALVGRFAH
jgi:hypothetical protein